MQRVLFHVTVKNGVIAENACSPSSCCLFQFQRHRLNSQRLSKAYSDILEVAWLTPVNNQQNLILHNKPDPALIITPIDKRPMEKRPGLRD